MKRLICVAVLLCITAPLIADISLTDKGSTIRAIANAAVPLSPRQKQDLRDANQAKRNAKKSRTGHHSSISTNTFRPRVDATGSVQLIDSAGLKYFINTNITFSTSSSASGAASEASYTVPVMASTTAGGVVSTSLSDAFDGYNALCVSLTNATGPCQTGNASYVMYEKNGPATVDAGVPAVTECTNRQYVLPPQTIGALTVQRKVYVPTNDQFIRWTNFFTNTSGAPVTFTTMTSNNLGSDSNTRIVSSSSGDAVAQTTDLWVSTFQNYSGSTSSDPRMGHVLQGTGASTPVSIINFADGDDNPFWGYSITLNPGQTKAIINFATAQPSKAAANAKSGSIAAFGATAQQCLSTTELSQVVNFASAADLSITKTSSAPTVGAGQSFNYTLNVTNNGPSTASSVTVTDVLPAGVTYVSSSGAGWSCGFAAGTVTCTMASLPVGAANPITINVTAPVTPGPLSNTATVSSSTTDGTPGNNSSTNNMTVTALADLSITKSASAQSVQSGAAFSYTLNVTNAGPNTATSVTVTDVLPAGLTYSSASGTGWSCAHAAGTVTCTMPSLPVGAANPITINVVASGSGATSNTATVSSATADPTPANNTSAAAAVALILPVPVLSPAMLALLAAVLAAIAIITTRSIS